METLPFVTLLDRAREKDPESQNVLVENFKRFIRSRLRRVVAKYYIQREQGIDDLEQEVWMQFFSNLTRFRLTERGQMLKLLTVITKRVAFEAVRTSLQDKRDVRRRSYLTDKQLQQLPSPPHRELWEYLPLGLSARDRQFIEQVSDGHQHVEIAHSLHCSTKTVQRILHQFEQVIEEE